MTIFKITLAGHRISGTLVPVSSMAKDETREKLTCAFVIPEDVQYVSGCTGEDGTARQFPLLCLRAPGWRTERSAPHRTSLLSASTPSSVPRRQKGASLWAQIPTSRR